MGKGDNRLQWKAWLIIVVFISYFTGSSFFLHSHTVDGVTIVHSHFHKEKHHSGQSGNHTSRDLALISHLSHFDKPAADKICSPEFRSTTWQILQFPDLTPGVTSASFRYVSLRAPPFA